MAIIEGDIDLTQNLDFYRKKPKKLLPANISLKGRQDEPELRINTDNINANIITSSSGAQIQLYYTNSQNYTYWTFDNNSTDNNEVNYLDIYDYDDNSLYTTSMRELDYDSTRSNTRVNITRSDSGDRISTYTFRSSYSSDYITSGNWTTVKNKINQKSKSTIKSIENKFKLWTGRPKLEEKETVYICYCYNCGKSFLSTFESGICKDCLKEDQEKKSMLKVIRFQGSRFEFNHVDYTQDYDYFEGVPWMERSRSKNLISYEEESRYRYGIPWFQKLNYRIYTDYIDELKYGDKDYSSYLTNMGWIGIHRQENDIGEINFTDSLTTIQIGNNNIIDSIQSVQVEEVHSDEELERRSIRRSNNSIQIRRHDDEIDSLSSWFNISDHDSLTYSI